MRDTMQRLFLFVLQMQASGQQAAPTLGNTAVPTAVVAKGGGWRYAGSTGRGGGDTIVSTPTTPEGTTGTNKYARTLLYYPELGKGTIPA